MSNERKDKMIDTATVAVTAAIVYETVDAVRWLMQPDNAVEFKAFMNENSKILRTNFTK